MQSSSPAITPQQAKFSAQSSSALNIYRELSVGSGSWMSLLYYEFALLIASNLSGILGYGLRSLVYPSMFKEVKGRLSFGRGVTIRVPGQISIGRGVLVDDYSALDVRGNEGSIALGDYVALGRYSIIAAKFGHITIGPGSNVGSHCRIATQSRVAIGESVLIGAYSYIGPGNHTHNSGSGDLISAPMDIKGGVSIGDHSWIGAGSVILDGVSIGRRCIVGAQSLVKDDVPDGATVVGTPARIVRKADGYNDVSKRSAVDNYGNSLES